MGFNLLQFSTLHGILGKCFEKEEWDLIYVTSLRCKQDFKKISQTNNFAFKGAKPNHTFWGNILGCIIRVES